MQSFVLDRHTDPSNPELKISQDDKIPVYDTVADAEADLANLADGQLIGTKDEREVVTVSSLHPVTITESTLINALHFDARFIINAAGVTLTLASTGVTEGIMVTLMAAYDATIVFNNTSSATTISDILHAGEIAKLVFIGGRWEVVQDLGKVEAIPTVTKPFGTLLVDGSDYAKIKYPRLANFIGTTYNLPTDSSDVFRVPDYRGEFLRGAGTNSHEGCGSGGTVGEHQDPTKLPNIDAWCNGSNANIGTFNPRDGATYSIASANPDTTSGSGYRQWATQSVGTPYSSPSFVTTRPTNTSVNWVIKY